MSQPQSLHGLLADKLSEYRRSKIAAALGYKASDERFMGRLNAIIEDELLGLESGGFDFRFTGEEFLRALCEFADLDVDFVDNEIERINEVINHRKTAFKPFLFVDTGFKRSTQPIFVLGFSEGFRRLTFAPSFRDLRVVDQVEVARKRVVEHYAESDGELTVWGTIQRYVFHYGDGLAVAIDVHGNIMAEADGFIADRASIRLNGNVVDLAISPK